MSDFIHIFTITLKLLLIQSNEKCKDFFNPFFIIKKWPSSDSHIALFLDKFSNPMTAESRTNHNILKHLIKA